LPGCQPDTDSDTDPVVHAYAISKSDSNGNIYSYPDIDGEFYSDTIADPGTDGASNSGSAASSFTDTATIDLVEGSSIGSNQSMKPTAPSRNKFRVVAATPCRGLSLSR
jgi:hypothetical protein